MNIDRYIKRRPHSILIAIRLPSLSLREHRWSVKLPRRWWKPVSAESRQRMSEGRRRAFAEKRGQLPISERRVPTNGNPPLGKDLQINEVTGRNLSGAADVAPRQTEAE